MHQIASNKKIERNDKKMLMFNSAISTGLSLLTSYTIDKITNKPALKLTEQFIKYNKNDPKLSKYLEGIKIAKPILIMGVTYYTLIPIISTFLADKLSNSKKY